jgi:hypothetical protein
VSGGLVSIDISVSVDTVTARPYCHITVTADDGALIAGYLPPDQVRIHALAWLCAAEVAEAEAGVFAAVDAPLAAEIVAEMRRRRSQRG